VRCEPPVDVAYGLRHDFLDIDGHGRAVASAHRPEQTLRAEPNRSGPRTTLHPYDTDAAERLKSELDSRLGRLTGPTRQARVIVVAQSMGGLVVGLGGAPDRQALITLGTQHRGPPKALDWLVNGTRIGPVRLKGASAVLAEWPRAYDLLPPVSGCVARPVGCRRSHERRQATTPAPVAPCTRTNWTTRPSPRPPSRDVADELSA
jgi:hypothetical protein